jgi:HEPN domain-containing protein
MDPLTGAERAARYRQRKAGKLVTPPPRSVQAVDTRHAMAVFEKGIGFRSAADKLFEEMKSPDHSLPLRDATYFLYHHAIELALKACLLSQGLHRTGHKISVLFDLCRERKLLDLGDIYFPIALLESGNQWNRYRYAVVNKTLSPDLSWVQEAVGQLFAAVEPQVMAWATNNSALPAPSTIWTCLGKPVVTKQPRPTNPGP